MIRKKCEYCGRILWMRSSAQEMCYRCFTEKQKQLGNTTGTCAICGKEFVKTRSNQNIVGRTARKREGVYGYRITSELTTRRRR